MIGGWLIKVLLGIALLGFATVELGSPLLARAQADEAAHDVANQVSFQLRDNRSQQTLRAACAAEAQARDVEIKFCGLDSAGNVAVSVTKEARSFLLHRIGPLKSWYQVEASVTADRK